MALTRLKDYLLRMPSINIAKTQIQAVKNDTSQSTLAEAIAVKEETIITAPVSRIASDVLQTSMESGILLGETKTRYSESVVDSFEDASGIDTSKSSHYIYDDVLKLVKSDT